MLENQDENERVIMEEHKKGHFGRDAVYKSMKQRYFFHGGMSETIGKIVSIML